MAKTIYVGNLPYTAMQEEVESLFQQFGNVQSFKWVTDRETGRFRGFAFVEMSEDEAGAAIEALNGNDFGGRPMRVNEAREQGPRPAGRSW